jgi:hypothetical protein
VITDLERMHRASLSLQEGILAAIERNTAAVLDNTAAIRAIASPEQRVSGTTGIASEEAFSRKGKLTRTR